MSLYRTAIASLGVAAIVVATVRVGSGQAPTPNLPGAPVGNTGQNITPAFEGWFANPDGSSTLIVGYYNRNAANTPAIDVPVGPNNRIEPGGPDMGQPTHFLGRRQWGMFSITVPKDNGNKKLTWTLTSNNQTSSITLWPNPPYSVDPFKSEFNGNTPPVVRLEPAGPEFKGPARGVAKTMAAVVGEPLTLTLWAKDAAPTIGTPGRGAGPGGGAAPPAGAEPGGRGRGGAPGAGAPAGGPGGGAPGAGAAGAGRGGPGAGPGGAPGGGAGGGRGGGGGNQFRMSWARFRGPAEPKFAAVNPTIDAAADGKAETTVTFPEPGEYWLRAQFNDSSGEGGGGDQCCWSSVLVRVNVKGK